MQVGKTKQKIVEMKSPGRWPSFLYRKSEQKPEHFEVKTGNSYGLVGGRRKVSGKSKWMGAYLRKNTGEGKDLQGHHDDLSASLFINLRFL